MEDIVRIDGRVLFLTQDAALIRRQLAGEDVDGGPGLDLLDHVSTDEISPAWACFHYDAELGRFTMTGLRGGTIGEGAIAGGGFAVLVAGKSFGCGSSREAAPFGQRAAGIRLVIAESFERIYAQNCQNIGVLLSTDFGLLPRIRAGEPIPMAELVEGLDPISARVVRAGGLFAYNLARLRGEITPPALELGSGPMTMAEKILTQHAVTSRRSQPALQGAPDHDNEPKASPARSVSDGPRGSGDPPRGSGGRGGRAGGSSEKPALFVRTDLRFSHEYVTPMAEALMRDALDGEVRITEPESLVLFRDHLTFLRDVMPEAKRVEGFLDRAEGLAEAQSRVARVHGLRLYGESPRGGAEAICHNAVVEDLALPGDVVVGTDSHSCTAGVLGCFAFGIGSTDMANAWLTCDVRVRVPETVQLVLHGRLRPGASAKDVMLHLLRSSFVRDGGLTGKVLEMSGDGLFAMPIDERATLSNMSVEAGATTAICEPDEAVIAYVAGRRGMSPDEVRARVVRSDANARFAGRIDIRLDEVEPMVALPGDPHDGLPISALDERVRIDIAYGGSCTGGKAADMDMYAQVFAAALARGRRVAGNVACHIQVGSQAVRRYARDKGYLDLFARAGAQLLGPSCGACINAGPGASSRPDQITVSAQNRNFPGRSGPGQVYLASPYTVAASAIEGRLASALPYLDGEGG